MPAHSFLYQVFFSPSVYKTHILNRMIDKLFLIYGAIKYSILNHCILISIILVFLNEIIIIIIIIIIINLYMLSIFYVAVVVS